MYYGADSFSNRHNGDRAAQRGANRIYRNLRRNISAILRAIRAAPRRAELTAGARGRRASTIGEKGKTDVCR